MKWKMVTKFGTEVTIYGPDDPKLVDIQTKDGEKLEITEDDYTALKQALRLTRFGTMSSLELGEFFLTADYVYENAELVSDKMNARQIMEEEYARAGFTGFDEAQTQEIVKQLLPEYRADPKRFRAAVRHTTGVFAEAQ